MKRLLLLPIALFLLNCSSDDNGEENDCDNRLFGLSQVGDIYYATYGTSQDTAGTVEINQSTYEHYSALGNPSDGSICWQGSQDFD